MPHSVYWPLAHMSQRPAAQAGHGTESRRRPTPTTRSPVLNPAPGTASVSATEPYFPGMTVMARMLSPCRLAGTLNITRPG
jgi:hypothetical protein